MTHAPHARGRAQTLLKHGLVSVRKEGRANVIDALGMATAVLSGADY